ncbi:MAG: LacI family DNA-binding transcriptional regulator [Lachnospiraceae bacterium]|nr:LacI family DNA-binding transcriptional regulator [Lachnospiraceae bacterium]
MEKVTMKDIADALNISRVTVSKAFNNQAGVSDALREQIFAKAGEMGYAKLPYQVIEPPVQEERTVSLIVSRPDSALFWTNIIHRMAQELLKYNINLMYTYVPSVYTRDFMLPSILLSGSVDGIIAVNVYAPEILDMVNHLPVPKIFLDTVPSLSERELTGDLVLIEGYRTEWDITQILIREGHKDIGFLGDINYARTNMERYRGYCDCMRRHGLTIRPEYCLTKAIDVFSYDRELRAYLSSLDSWPTAFVCVSDYVAHFVQTYIDEKSKQLPPPVVLTGFDNAGEYTSVAGRIITANVSTELLGRRLALQLLFRTQYPDAPYELTFIMPSIIRFR